jgi:cytochrome c oxidase assembly factor CtaG
MVLSMLVPILLALGAPVTLALRALRPASEPGMRGPREWLLLGLHSRVGRVVTHPLFALGLFVGSLFVLYFSPLLETLMRSHTGHLAMQLHFLVTGYLFFWAIIGLDPAPYRPPHLVRIPLLFAGMSFHAFFGVVLLQSQQRLGDSWFASVAPPWAGPALDDQQLGAGITWAFGEIPTLIVMAALFFQWIKADEREQRRLDRAADRAEARAAAKQAAAAATATAAETAELPETAETADAGSATVSADDEAQEEDELAAYNAYLRRLHEQDVRRGVR